MGKLSLERDRTNCLGPVSTDLLFNTISVFINTLDIYEELQKKMYFVYKKKCLTKNYRIYLKFLMLNAVLSNLVGVTGILLQNVGMALSMSFLIESVLQSAELFAEDECLLNRMRIANATR